MTTDTLSKPLPTRRSFLKIAGAAAATALTIGFEWSGSTRRAAAGAAVPSTTPFTPNAFIRVGSDNSVTVIAKHVEMGQGAYTGIATVVAEELDADWAQVRVESAPADAKLLEARSQLANLVTYMDGKSGAEDLIAKVLNDPALLKSLAAKAKPQDGGNS